jgi:hypothetical protein
MIPAFVQMIFGVQMTGKYAAPDGAFTVETLNQFSAEVAQGYWLPRWSWTGNGSLGSPIFFFYPPGAYLLSTPLHLLLPHLPLATVVGIMGIVFRALGILTCALWLHQRYGPTLALAGGAVYVLMPYIAFYNPQYRLAYAESGATFLLPLLFLSLDKGYGRFALTIFLSAPVILLLAIFHLPSTLIGCVLAFPYAVLLADSRRTVILQMSATLCAVLLGLALASFTLLPALRLLPEVLSAALNKFGWQGFFLFRLRDSTNPYYLILDACLLVPLLGAAAGVGRTFADQGFRALAGSFVTAAFLTLPLSWPLWKTAFPLQRIQFPWRFLLPTSLTAAGLIVNGLSTHGLKFRVCFAVAVAAVLSIITAVSLLTSDAAHTDEERTSLALAAPFADAPEYIPVNAARKGWAYFQQNGGSTRKRAASFISSCLGPARRIDARSVSFDVSHCSGPVVLPQFYFPGWTAYSGGPLAVAPDPSSGLVRVDAVPGKSQLVLSRHPVPEEEDGFKASMAAFLAWVGCGVLALVETVARGRYRR